VSEIPQYHEASLHRVIDGDTVVMNVDLGFRIYATVHIRFKDINCPEHNKPGGAEATKFTEDWFSQRVGPFVLGTWKDPDVYCRWLGVIYPPGARPWDPGSALPLSLNEVLVLQGHAVRSVYK
jgi:endonuclease YncB( thermonuclease family)